LQPGAPPLTARELAGLSGVELKTVHNWVRRGLLSHFRTPGRHLRFHPEDAGEFLARCGYASAGTAVRGVDGSRTLVIAAGRARTLLRRALRDLPVSWADEPWSGLIAAGREQPSAVVLEASALRSTDARAVIRALTRQLAHARVVWVGAARPPLAALHWISLSDTRALRAELGLT
jgi:excisionase family DNA binding protein